MAGRRRRDEERRRRRARSARSICHRYGVVRAHGGAARAWTDDRGGHDDDASAIGSTFDGRIVEETTVGGRPAIVPAIRGSAWITGTSELYVDVDDPFPEGYLLSDTWPGDDVQ